MIIIIIIAYYKELSEYYGAGKAVYNKNNNNL